MRRLHVCFWVISLHPRLITSDHGLQELRIPVGALQHVPHDLEAELLCSSCESSLSTNLATTLHMCNSSVTSECAGSVLIPTSSAIFRTVKRRSSRMRECTFSMTFAFRVVDGLPERWSLLRPSLKWLNHSLIWVAPISSSPKPC
jgi:hypothetical protein